jgi:uncharacterized protein (DUF58 family)
MDQQRQRFGRFGAFFRRVPLTREGLLWFIVASGLLLMGLAKGINLVTLLASLLVVLVLWNWWEARRQLRPIRVARLEDEPAFAGIPFRWALRIHNAGSRTVAGINVHDGDGPQRRSWFVTELAGGAAAVLRGEITFPRRGIVDGQALTIESGHPLGLVCVRGPLKNGPSRVVFPKLGQLQRAALRRYLSRQSPSLGQSRGLPCHAPTAQAEFHGLRPYRPGDSPRHLHWRTTARRGKLMVREYEDWPNDDLTVVLEARKGAGKDDDPDLERGISLAATICWEWCRQTGDRLVLAVAGATVTIQEGVTGRRLALDLLERLALEPGAVEIDSNSLVEQLAGRRLSPGPILVIAPAASDLAARLELGLRRRTAAVAPESGNAGEFFELQQRDTRCRKT